MTDAEEIEPCVLASKINRKINELSEIDQLHSMLNPKILPLFSSFCNNTDVRSIYVHGSQTNNERSTDKLIWFQNNTQRQINSLISKYSDGNARKKIILVLHSRVLDDFIQIVKTLSKKIAN